MITTAIVSFKLAAGIDRSALRQRYESTAPKWAQNPDLIEKWYFHDPENHEGGGVYIWKSREAAQRWFSPEFQAAIERLYGSPPRIRLLDAVLHVDPSQKSYRVLD